MIYYYAATHNLALKTHANHHTRFYTKQSLFFNFILDHAVLAEARRQKTITKVSKTKHRDISHYQPQIIKMTVKISTK